MSEHYDVYYENESITHYQNLRRVSPPVIANAPQHTFSIRSHIQVHHNL